MASVPSASARAAVIRCRGSLFGRKQPKKASSNGSGLKRTPSIQWVPPALAWKDHTGWASRNNEKRSVGTLLNIKCRRKQVNNSSGTSAPKQPCSRGNQENRFGSLLPFRMGFSRKDCRTRSLASAEAVRDRLTHWHVGAPCPLEARHAILRLTVPLGPLLGLPASPALQFSTWTNLVRRCLCWTRPLSSVWYTLAPRNGDRLSGRENSCQDQQCPLQKNQDCELNEEARWKVAHRIQSMEKEGISRD
ncbi:uncharacterized protein LOC114650769 [Erpetoichthys calabaricus]|uniref:uncharacterized protein LOC114650769 n=1 Tax=Erpetoichthys calabaricus TaxID=27687 RepID=UPI0010A03E75|nr:uncharacterized protein LOC114650769 [Erpetoichthys calabaricus]